jgi:4-hydroxybenzoate polyprenyltransferase
MDFKKIAGLLMIEQTTFALPYAYMGLLFAGGGSPGQWILVTIALAAARTGGMSFNRVLDAEVDAKNPRTAERHIPAGTVSPTFVWGMGLVSCLVLIIASFFLNRLVFILSFPAVGLLYTYSLFKRFSATSHFYLGIVEAAAPVGGYLAVTGKFDFLTFVPGAAILFWIAGIDILYAVQDIDFDRREGLYSIPARLGRKKSVILSMVCYALSVIALIAAGYMAGMNNVYWSGVLAAAFLFARQQFLAQGGSEPYEERMKKVFALNRYISPVIFFAALIDVLMRTYW